MATQPFDTVPWRVALDSLDLMRRDLEQEHGVSDLMQAGSCDSGTRLPLLIVVVESVAQKNMDVDGIASVVDRTGRLTAHLHKDLMGPDFEVGWMYVLFSQKKGCSGQERVGACAKGCRRHGNREQSSVEFALPPDTPLPSRWRNRQLAVQGDEGHQLWLEDEPPQEEQVEDDALVEESRHQECVEVEKEPEIQATSSHETETPVQQDTQRTPLPRAWIERWCETACGMDVPDDWEEQVIRMASQTTEELEATRNLCRGMLTQSPGSEAAEIMLEACDNALALLARRGEPKLPQSGRSCFCGCVNIHGDMCLDCGRDVKPAGRTEQQGSSQTEQPKRPLAPTSVAAATQVEQLERLLAPMEVAASAGNEQRERELAPTTGAAATPSEQRAQLPSPAAPAQIRTEEPEQSPAPAASSESRHDDGPSEKIPPLDELLLGRPLCGDEFIDEVRRVLVPQLEAMGIPVAPPSSAEVDELAIVNEILDRFDAEMEHDWPPVDLSNPVYFESEEENKAFAENMLADMRRMLDPDDKLGGLIAHLIPSSSNSEST